MRWGGRPVIIAIASLGLIAVFLTTSHLLVGFLAGLGLVCLLPGLALTDLLSERLGPLDWTEKVVVSVGAGYILLIIVAMALICLPIPLSRGGVLAAFLLLLMVLLGLRLGRRGHGGEPPAAPSRWVVWAFLLTAGVAFALRFPNLGYSEFIGDEAKVMLWAAEVVQGHRDVLFLYRKGPAEILITAVFYALLGRTDELVARLPFTVANLTAMLALFQLGRSMFGLKVGLAVGLLAGIEGIFVGLARVVQYQSLVILLGCLALWCLYRCYRGWVQAPVFLGAVAMAAGFLCHWDMLFVMPAAAYLAVEALRRHGRAIWRHRLWPIVGGALATTVLAGFFLPYVLDPHFQQTSRYLAKRVRASRLPYCHLRTFFDYGAVYNASYYALFIALVVLLALAYLTARSIRWTGLSLPARIGILLCVPATLFMGVGTEHSERVALLACALMSLIFILLSHHSVETKALSLWFLIPFIAHAFVIRLPQLHICNLSPAASLLGGLAVTRSLGRLSSVRWRRLALGGLVLWYLVSANYIRMAFLQAWPEYQRGYPDHRHPAYWTPYGDALPRVNAVGFSHAAGWKVVGALYGQGLLEGDFDSNEKEMITRWYTRGAVRCKYGPRYYLLAEAVQDEQPVPLDVLAEGYALTGVVSVGGRETLRIYERRPPASEGVARYRAEDWAAFFDAQLSGPALYTGVRRPIPAAAIPNPVDLRFGDHLRVLGYRVEGARFQPGGDVVVTVYWQMLGPLDPKSRLVLQLGWGEDRRGQKDAYPGCGLLSESDWAIGDIVADRYSLIIFPETPSGWYPLWLGMYDLEAGDEGGRRVPIFDAQGGRVPGDRVFLTKLQVGEPDIQGEIGHPTEFTLGEQVALLGYDLSRAEVAPGSTLRLTLYWQARSQITTSYTVFTHIVDTTGRLWGQHDGLPDGGRNPTHRWVPGEIVVDRHEIPVDREAAPGEYLLRVGMYDLRTGERLPVRDAAGRRLEGACVPLGRVDIREE